MGKPPTTIEVHVEASHPIRFVLDTETVGYVVAIFQAEEPTVILTCSLVISEGWVAEVCAVTVNGKALKEGDQSRLGEWKGDKGLRLDKGDVLIHCWNCTRVSELN